MAAVDVAGTHGGAASKVAQECDLPDCNGVHLIGSCASSESVLSSDSKPISFDDLPDDLPLNVTVNEWRANRCQQHERERQKAQKFTYDMPTKSSSESSPFSSSQPELEEGVSKLEHSSASGKGRNVGHRIEPQMVVPAGSIVYKLLVFNLTQNPTWQKRVIHVYNTKLVKARFSVQECRHIKLCIEDLNIALQYRLPKEAHLVALEAVMNKHNSNPEADRITFFLQRKRSMFTRHEKAMIGVMVAPPCSALFGMSAAQSSQQSRIFRERLAHAATLPGSGGPRENAEKEQRQNRDAAPTTHIVHDTDFSRKQKSQTLPHNTMSNNSSSFSSTKQQSVAQDRPKSGKSGHGTAYGFRPSGDLSKNLFDADKLEKCSFFHHLPDFLAQHERRQLLESILSGRRSGSWLLRANKSKGIYVITMIYNEKVYHIPIVQQANGVYSVSDDTFGSVEQLLEHYTAHNISDKIATPLVYPVLQTTGVNYCIYESNYDDLSAAAAWAAHV